MHPGDIIVGDRDGVMVMPRDIAQEVINNAANIGAKEVSIKAALRCETTWTFLK